MNKFFVCMMLGVLVFSSAGVLAVDQTIGGQPVSITVNDLDFGFIFNGGTTVGMETIFTVNPLEFTGDLEITDISDSVTGTATIEYSLDNLEGSWFEDTGFTTPIILSEDPTPTLYVRLANVAGTEPIAGTVTYTIMAAEFAPLP